LEQVDDQLVGSWLSSRARSQKHHDDDVHLARCIHFIVRKNVKKCYNFASTGFHLFYIRPKESPVLIKNLRAPAGCRPISAPVFQGPFPQAASKKQQESVHAENQQGRL
jgi:hypothetical protein